MSTRRHYNEKKTNFNQIEECFYYIKVKTPLPLAEFQHYNTFTKRSTVTIPRDIKWKIEEDWAHGAQDLANWAQKQVVVSMDGKSDQTLPKFATPKDGGNGHFQVFSYVRAGPKNKVFFPTNYDVPDGEVAGSEVAGSEVAGSEVAGSEVADGADEDRMKIRLLITPSTEHYLHTAERRKHITRGCPCCLVSNNRIVGTIGTGKKSSLKTKGRCKRRQDIRVEYP